MKKEKINIPPGIRFISEWKNFFIPEHPCIINKQITGCGFTEFCITFPANVILCSPRKILLENKENQHPEVLYVRNELEASLAVDKDLFCEDRSVSEVTTENFDKLEVMKSQVKQFTLQQSLKHQPVKILVTYDSFRHVRDAIKDLSNYFVIVDEFQSIFTDSKFKSNTELEFLRYVQDLQKVCFVSATPMMDKYLDMLPEFKDLPYYELDWAEKDPGRVAKPMIEAYPCKSIIQEAVNIINSYKEGRFDKHILPDHTVIESKECVIYVNSVRNICDIVKKAGLKIEETNILCSRTPENERKLRTLLKLPKDISAIGRIPIKNEPRKMFTICTRTVYLGADFYSPCAKTFIFSDANIDCLAVDITLDLPQIMGRQRLIENPWKNYADLYFKSIKLTESNEEFMNRLNEKINRTNSLLKSYREVTDKHTLAETYQYVAKTANYKDNYIAVNEHAGKDLMPVFNNLVMVSEMRSFEIQQIDYKDRFTVFSAIEGQACRIESYDKINSIIKSFDLSGNFVNKMKYLCTLDLSAEDWSKLEKRIPIEFRNYFNILGKERIKSLSYQKSKLEAEYERVKANKETQMTLEDLIYSSFIPGEKYSKAWIKSKLGEIYNTVGYKLTPKATDLERYFKIKAVNYMDKVSKKKENGYSIINKL